MFGQHLIHLPAVLTAPMGQPKATISHRLCQGFGLTVRCFRPFKHVEQWLSARCAAPPSHSVTVTNALKRGPPAPSEA